MVFRFVMYSKFGGKKWFAKCTEISTEDQLMSYASDEYHKQAMYKKIWNILRFFDSDGRFLSVSIHNRNISEEAP